MKNLTKETFWDDLMERHPEKMRQFCEWIDKYKYDNEWPALFSQTFYKPGKPKYHDLPIAMQMGIFAQFAAEQENRDFEGTVSGTIQRWFIAADSE